MRRLRRWPVLLLIALVLIVPVVLLAMARRSSGRIVYSRQEGDRCLLHVMNADGTDDRLLPGQQAPVNVFPTWSPDGRQIAFMAGESLEGDRFQIQVLNADGTGARTVQAPGEYGGMPAWSPDGKRLAFMAGQGDPGVFVAEADGSYPRRISPPATVALAPFWLPDGRVAYSRVIGEGRAEIVAGKPDETVPQALTRAGQFSVAGANVISPDGERMLYQVIQPAANSARLRVRPIAGGDERVLREAQIPSNAAGPYYLVGPAWAPDGKSVLVTVRTEKGYGLFLLREDGRSKTRLTPEGINCFGGAWTAQR